MGAALVRAPARLSGRRLVGAAAVFLLLTALGACPSARLALAFSAGYCPIANVMLARGAFGQGGHARLVPADTLVRHPGDSVIADVALALSVDGWNGELPIGLSLRRDAFLPLWIFFALAAAAPLGLARRARILAVGLPVIAALGLLDLRLLATWFFADNLRGVYPDSLWWRPALRFLFDAWLTPPGNRFISPLAFGLGLIAWHHWRESAPVGATRDSKQAPR